MAGASDVVMLIATLHIRPTKSGWPFVVAREATGDVVVARTLQPIADGARALIARGLPPSTLVNMRHADKPYPSFKPMPAGWWAQWSYEESNGEALRRIRWKPFAKGTGAQKSGAEEPGATSPSRTPLMRVCPSAGIGHAHRQAAAA